MRLSNTIIVSIDYLIKNIIGGIFSKRNRQHGVGTGRVAEDSEKPEVLITEGTMIFVYHPYSIAHSLWRSQEYSLINEYKHLLQAPIFDLGCGDGSFSKILFNEITYGVDPDTTALEGAKRIGLYKNLLNVPAENTGLESGTIGSVFSNSVLEHTQNLPAIIKEMNRILMPGGKLMLTVPNDVLVTQLTKLFGRAESDRMNGPLLFSHYNLLSNKEWTDLLVSNGFEIEILQNYQHQHLIESYRRYGFFIMRIYERLLKRKPYGKTLDKLYKLVKTSLANKEGSCTFIIAAKK